ncbi:MAG: enoyl-CoA hydratase/isomerase family protein [Acidimicrobiia bacterium]
MTFLRCERSATGVETIWLDRPPVNALSSELLEELAGEAHRLTLDPDCKAVIVAGSGKAFAAGADIGQFGSSGNGVGAHFRLAFDNLAAIPRPVIAAIHGYALGGGAELALACDLRMMADTARIGFPEILLGLFPGAGGTQRLPRIVGPARAKELIWSGRNVGAEEAVTIGLVDRVVPADELIAAAQAWAESLASGAVVAMGLAKASIDQGLDRDLAGGLDIEAEHFVAVFATEDARVGVESFLANGPGMAKFTGK